MKALVLRRNADLEYMSVGDPEPEPASGRQPEKNILVQVAYSGICGSDIPRAYTSKAYHYPLVMGHEFSGIVREAPAGSRFPVGSRVVVFPLLPCYTCTACRTGEYAQCSGYDYYGSRRDGGFAEYVRVSEANLFAVPDTVDLVSAAMTEPCAVALHGVEKLAVEAGMSALVIGGGPIGNMVAQWLRVKGCDRIYLADVDPRKLEIASGMGFIPVDSSKGDPVETLRSLEGADGTDCVVEACGLPLTFLQAVRSAGRFGQIVFMGNIAGTFSIPEKDFSNILRNEIRITGTWNSRIEPRGKDEWTRVLQFLDHRIQVKPLISHLVPLSRGREIFDQVSGKKQWFNKVIFSVQDEQAK